MLKIDFIALTTSVTEFRNALQFSVMNEIISFENSLFMRSLRIFSLSFASLKEVSDKQDYA